MSHIQYSTFNIASIWKLSDDVFTQALSIRRVLFIDSEYWFLCSNRIS